MAAAYASVLPDERTRGVAVIDLGFDSTGLVIYDGDRCVLASNVPVTSDHLTRDIAYMFKVSYEDAECLKQQYGCAMIGLTAESSLIEVPSPEGRGAVGVVALVRISRSAETTVSRWSDTQSAQNGAA